MTQNYSQQPRLDLLTREQFRQAVFARDGSRCVFCGAQAVNAHHIMERRLFIDGGYFLDNGASVCAAHHLACESTEISTQQVRDATQIRRVILPSHLYEDQVYDKWGNIILPDGRRLRGELFYDESVQKALRQFLGEFTHHIKYPRTFHLPFSPGVHNDDRVMNSLDGFQDKEVVVFIKMDGENTTMYRDYIHARSLDFSAHLSRDWVKAFWASISLDIPEGWRVNGENMFAEHSIHYNNLPSYFLGFAIWNDKNFCLDWNETEEWLKLLGIVVCPIVYIGKWDVNLIRMLAEQEVANGAEGLVVRTTHGFSYGNFRKFVGKYVRKDHIQTTKHWMMGRRVVENELANSGRGAAFRKEQI